MYNPLTDSWMIPQNDPYTLENFQQAYNNLASGKSLQTLTRAEAVEFSEDEKLEPTHFALRIYPKTEEEQWRVEMMEDVSVVYAPFGYSGLTTEEVERAPQTRAEIASPFEISPYTVTYENYESTDGGPTDPVTYQLPVLYTVWPADKPLPDDLEHKVDYSVFLPHEAPVTRSNDEMLILTTEAMALASGDPEEYLAKVKAYSEDYPATRGVIPYTNKGRIMTYDDVLKKDVPLANLKVMARSGSNTLNTYTDSDGYFSLTGSFAILGWADLVLPLTLTYQDPLGDWKITTEKSTSPYSVTIQAIFRHSSGSAGVFSSFWSGILPNGDRQENIVHRAVNYFYYEGSSFPKYSPGSAGGLRIIADISSNNAAHGKCSVPREYDPHEAPWITIYNNSNRESGEVIGTTLHEIGHFIHAWGDFQNDYDNYENTHDLLCESFASYVGWFLGEEYYKSEGWIKPASTSYSYSDITGQSRQEWTGSDVGSGGWSSPLFIDLTDDFDRRSIYPYDDYTPIDYIKNVRAYDIMTIIRSVTAWAECKQMLVDKVGKWYTRPEFDYYISGYEYWFSNN